jgi:membrane-associated phospholipid phosphatase
MALITVQPTVLDKRIAKLVSREADPRIEKTAEALTWGADEHLLLIASGVFWLASRRSDKRIRQTATHCLITTVAASILPHVLKTVVDQERPDRKLFARHRRGIPYSGQPKDAFPSGHALHMGALASFATLMPRRFRYSAWAAASVLMATRVVLLAHWVTDVAAGFAAGVGLERAIRVWTRPRQITRKHPRVLF